MVRIRHSPEQIVAMLREAEALLNRAAPVAEVCRKLGVSEQTYDRWRKEHGGMRSVINEKRRERSLLVLQGFQGIGHGCPDRLVAHGEEGESENEEGRRDEGPG
jgi:hypothetical protein